MNKATNKLIPELRFPEFANDGEWGEKSLGEVGEFMGGGTPDTSISEYWNGEIQWFTPTEIKDGIVRKSLRTITDKGLHNSSAKLLPFGTILITTRATIGDVGIAKEPCTTNQGFQSLIVKKGQHNIFWYYWLIQHKNELTLKASGSTFPEIGKNEIIKIISLSPQISEQQKIASCLSSLDEVIAAHSQKLEAFKDHKKGLMQNLFPQEGETVPKYRFSKFEKDGEWVEKKLESLAQLITEKTGFRKYKLMSVTAGVGLVSQMEKFGREIAGESYKNYYVIRKGDFVYNKSSVKIHPEGQIALLEYEDSGAVPNSIFTCFRVDESFILPNFLKYPFENNLHGNWLRKFISIGARANGALNVDNKDLLTLPVTFPSLQEQQKIASCLSSLTDLITALSEKIEQLKLHKKGLMQGLFPKINE